VQFLAPILEPIGNTEIPFLSKSIPLLNRYPINQVICHTVTRQPQPFPGPKTVEDSCDEIDAVLNEMVSGTVVTSPVNPNEEEIKFFKPCVIKDKNHYQKVT